MALKLDEMVVKLLEIYTQEELRIPLGVTLKSIDNYKNGKKPNKKVIAVIIEIYKKVSEAGWKKIDLSAFGIKRHPPTQEMTLHDREGYRRTQSGNEYN